MPENNPNMLQYCIKISFEVHEIYIHTDQQRKVYDTYFKQPALRLTGALN
jgi:hypothetical protein